MKTLLRFVAALCVLLHCSLFFLLNSERVSAQYIQRRYYRKKSTTELPFYGLTRTVSTVSLLSPIEDESRGPFNYSKLRFAPVKILGRVVQTPKSLKEFPHTYWASKRKRIPPRETRKPHTGVIVELESAYGIYNTFIGRLQHGTQFKGAHYYISGHWEKTDGEYGGDRQVKGGDPLEGI